MRKILLYSALIFVLWALFARWYYTCRIKNSDCCGSERQEVQLPKNAAPLKLMSGVNFVLKGFEQFPFQAGKATLSEFSPSNDDFFTKTLDYLKNNPEKKLTITGHYLKSEGAAVTGNFENLGMARAAAMRDALVKAGLSTDRITLASKMLNDTYLSQTLSFDANDGADAFANLDISDENFATNSAVFSPRPKFVAQVALLKEYLTKHPNPYFVMTIIGHTDNVGADDGNMKLGQRRADAVKAFLASSGIKMPINTSSKGELEPIFDNNTEEGRAQNRRVNCHLTKG
ncbi:MAG: hypothetical protein RLZZ292_1641 [Bacteroidota bacterium]|jgi:OOP family OmpA-OmpF porin